MTSKSPCTTNENGVASVDPEYIKAVRGHFGPADVLGVGEVDFYPTLSKVVS